MEEIIDNEISFINRDLKEKEVNAFGNTLDEEENNSKFDPYLLTVSQG